LKREGGETLGMSTGNPSGISFVHEVNSASDGEPNTQNHGCRYITSEDGSERCHLQPLRDFEMIFGEISFLIEVRTSADRRARYVDAPLCEAKLDILFERGSYVQSFRAGSCDPNSQPSSPGGPASAHIMRRRRWKRAEASDCADEGERPEPSEPQG